MIVPRIAADSVGRGRDRTRTVGFDLDGTILDHDAAVRMALRRLCDTTAICAPVDDVLMHWRAAGDTLFPAYLHGALTFDQQLTRRVGCVLERYGMPVSAAQAALYAARYRDDYEQASRLYKDTSNYSCRRAPSAFAWP